MLSANNGGLTSPSRATPSRTQTLPLHLEDRDRYYGQQQQQQSAYHHSSSHHSQQHHQQQYNNSQQPQWGAPPQANTNPYQELPKPRPQGLYAQQNHSTPSLAFKGHSSSGPSTPLEAVDAPPVPSMDDISIGLENMRFQQRDPQESRFTSGSGVQAGSSRDDDGVGQALPSAGQGPALVNRHSDPVAQGRPSSTSTSNGGPVGQDGAMEIRGKEGNTASVYSLDSGFSPANAYSNNSHGAAQGGGGPGGSGSRSGGAGPSHARTNSQTSVRTYGAGGSGENGAPFVEGYSDDRRYSAESTYLPYDQPYNDYSDQMRPPPQGHQFYPDAVAGGAPYYPQDYHQDPYQQQQQQHHPNAQHLHHYPQQGFPPPHQQFQPPPQFAPQPQHAGWGYDHSQAAAQNPYYAAATGQLGFPDGSQPPYPPQPHQNGGLNPPYQLNRAMSSASSMSNLSGNAMPGGKLVRSGSQGNLGTTRRKGTGSSTNGSGNSGPPITKQSVDEYRSRIKADPDPEAQFNFAKYLIEAAKKISSSASGDEKSAKKYRDALLAESLKLIKRLATQGVGLGKPAYADAQFFLANCLGNGSLGLQVDHEKAYNLYVQASKQNHSSATYRTAVCNEVGAGTRRDHARAVLFYRKASALGDTAGMYKLGMILLNGLLGQQRNVKEAVAWLKRAAAQADEDNPHALHELGLLYEKAPPPGQPGLLASIIPNDHAQARELFTQAGQFGYPPSQFKLGSCYEYGTLTCPVDPRRSIAWYTRAAERGDAEAELALSGWYLTGSDGVLKQSDSEAYLWARRAANKGLPKAEYAVGYYSEVGIGVKQDLEEAKRWYMRAAAQGNKRAMQRLSELREMTKTGGKAKPAQGGRKR